MSDRFTLASWNLFQGLHQDSSRRRWVHNQVVEEHLRVLDADVLVLPEAWLFEQPEALWAEDLAAALGYEVHQWTSASPSRTREMLPWRMTVMTRIPARRLPDHVMPQFAPFGQRAFVQVELNSGVTIAGAHLYGIHLLAQRSPRGWLAERKEFVKVAAKADVVAGDMNMWTPMVQRDAPALRPAVRGRTFPASWPHSQIDHIMVSKRIEVVSSQVVPPQGSDHLAIKATLELR